MKNGDDSGSRHYRDGYAASVIGKTIVGVFIAFAWIMTGGKLHLQPGDPGYKSSK